MRKSGPIIFLTVVCDLAAVCGLAPGQSISIAPQRSVKQRTSRTAAVPHADWTGYYTLATARKDLGGFTPLNSNLNELITDHLRPWARARMAATDGIAEDTAAVCHADGPFRFLPAAGRFYWLPGIDTIALVSDEVVTGGIQRIYMNRPHPRILRTSWNGDSIGRWEGDTLVVDTVGLNDKSWLGTMMQPHTEEAHMIQRIQRVAGGGNVYLEIHTTVEDRHALTSAYAFSRYYKRVGAELPEFICADDTKVWRQWKDQALKPHLERAREVK